MSRNITYSQPFFIFILLSSLLLSLILVINNSSTKRTSVVQKEQHLTINSVNMVYKGISTDEPRVGYSYFQTCDIPNATCDNYYLSQNNLELSSDKSLRIGDKVLITADIEIIGAALGTSHYEITSLTNLRL